MTISNNLKVAILQADLVWEKPTENLTYFETEINKIVNTVDLIVLPEMFTTGFSMNVKNLAENMNGTTVTWMQKMASEKQTAIVGSIIIEENDKYYNRLLFVYPEGKIEYYDKRHAFTLAGENEVFSEGKKQLIVNYKGWKICPFICYDLRFPVWSRNTQNYDLLLYIASWPKPRIKAWDTLLQARAIENMSYTIGVNRVGKDANNYEYSGNSNIIDCLGNNLASFKEGEIATKILTLNKNYQEEVRTKLNFLNDKDSFTIQ